MQSLSIRGLFLTLGIVAVAGIAGCSDRESQVILDTSKTPEEIQAEYDAYDNEQADEAYE